VTSAFALHGLIGAAWVPRIPQVKERLGLDAGALGVVLLGAPVGVVVAVRVAGTVVARWGARATTLGAGSVAAIALVPLGLASDLPTLVTSLVLLGGSLGLMDVAMNAQGVELERGYARPLMSGLHGAYSVGAILGAITGSAAASAQFPVRTHLSMMAVALCVLLWTLCRAGLEAPPPDPRARPASPSSGEGWVLARLGVIGLCAFVGEGAMADWSAVYLRETLGAGPGVAGLGYAGFATAMATGRVSGDWALARWGPLRVVRAGSLAASAGLAAGLLAQQPAIVVACFSLFGLGVAVVAPVTFGAAGNLPGVAAAAGIARVTTVGYLGLLGGPPVIGLVAQAAGLRWALAIPALLAAAVAALAGAVAVAAPER
jgi:MFS family permease